MEVWEELQLWFTTQLPDVVQALLILLIGWLIALILAAVTRRVLNRVRADERLNRQMEPQQVSVSGMVSQAVFWLVLLFAVVGALEVLDLGVIAGPLGGLLDQVIGFIPNLIGAAILAAVAWLVATMVSRLVEGALNATDWDERLSRQAQMERPVPLAESLSTLAYWLVWLLFLPAILGALELEGLLDPVEAMVAELVAFLPNLLSAAIILIVGYFVARIVRDIVTNLLAASGLDRFGERYGLGEETATTPSGRVEVYDETGDSLTATTEPLTLSRVVGTVVFALILIPVAITALDALNLEAISLPAIAMLNQVLDAIPNIFGAALLLGIAYFVARFVADIVSEILAGIGFNRFLSRIGLHQATREGSRPSELAGTLIIVGIMLFAAAEAADLLGFAALAGLITSFLIFFGNVLLGLIVLGLGLYFANLADQAIRGSNVKNDDLLATMARYSIIGLAIFMALQQMGIAIGIVTLAFTLLLGAVAVAAALAFGLGGREIAQRELDRLVSDLRNRPQDSTITAPKMVEEEAEFDLQSRVRPSDGAD
ncbi:MAG: mechanosensitive ion channel [Chloroflexota bacterium]|nr:mechanosensitive ion channel [Chloroflexota bacterium]